VESEPIPARDAVNEPMIRHWCDAVDDRNPVYTEPEVAGKSIHGGIVAPPTMLQAWTMPGLRRDPAGSVRSGPLGRVLALLDEAGFTSVVATNCRQEYRRYLRPGDRLSVRSAIESVSDEKRTALGVGRFVDQVMVYRDQDGEEVARMRFRILKFRPPEREAAPDAAGRAPSRSASTRPAARAKPRLRPRPARTKDNDFYWSAIQERRLLIQRCARCERLRHPPGPMCPHCHSFAWDTVEASGRGRVFSYVVAHHPPIPPFEYPNCVALIELEEGTRMVSNLVGIDPDAVEIDMPVALEFADVDPELVLPVFRPTRKTR
jgi:uncharacterized OB-fold protein/acyl dehydratase